MLNHTTFPRKVPYGIANYAELITKRSYFNDMPETIRDAPVADNLQQLLTFIETHNLPQVYVTIDEYDNFANQLVTGHKDWLYRELTRDSSFLKTFFKTLKEGRQSGVIANVYITGVLPILIDDLSSGFNICTFLTLKPEFEQMLGFTQSEVDRVLDDVYADYGFAAETRGETVQDEDTRQIAGYVEGLQQEYPESRISQFVIYCVGNQGFRVCEVL